jgi:sulfoxide reductase heme-binding subunit YedZ
MSPMIGSTRFQRRLRQHHLPLFFLSGGSVVLLYFTRPYKNWVTRASFATAYPALVLLAATLLIGPWNLLRRRGNPVSSDLRRDLGIWAGVLSVVHAAVGQCVHLRGRPWLYYIYGPTERHHGFPVRHDVFGVSNFTGLVAAFTIVMLLATSNDFSLRALKAPRWKTLQRWSYAVFVLVVIHTFGYQIGVEKQDWRFVALAAISIVVAVIFQALGIAKVRSAAETDGAR